MLEDINHILKGKINMELKSKIDDISMYQVSGNTYDFEEGYIESLYNEITTLHEIIGEYEKINTYCVEYDNPFRDECIREITKLLRLINNEQPSKYL